MPNETVNKILDEIRNTAKDKFLPIVDYFEGGKGDFLDKLIRLKRPKEVLEIGTLVGYSGIKIICNLPPNGKLTTLEVDSENAQVAQENFNEAGMANKVQIVIGDATETIPKLKNKFDFVFIDAAKGQYLTYLKLLEENNLLQPKATILADNVKMFAADMKEYLNYVRKSGKYKSSYHDFGQDGMEVSQLS